MKKMSKQINILRRMLVCLIILLVSIVLTVTRGMVAVSVLSTEALSPTQAGWLTSQTTSTTRTSYGGHCLPDGEMEVQWAVLSFRIVIVNAFTCNLMSRNCF